MAESPAPNPHVLTPQEATDLGYKVIKASPCEVGLIKGEKGIRTWWCNDFDRKLPEIGHPIIMELIQRLESK